MENHNIVIIGMPGSGKTTFGTALAEALGRDFYDADTYLETSEGRTIKELFAVSEDCFRDAETRTARALGSKKGVVIATGGGVIKRRENIDIYKENGIIIFLDRAPENIVTDVDVSTRPLLKDGPSKVFDLYRERIDTYRSSADYHMANDESIEHVLEHLERLVKELLEKRT